MKSFFAGLACCGLGLSLNTPIGVAAEWEPVNTDAESKSTTSNQVVSGRSTQWSPVQSKSGKSTKTNRQAVWTPVEPLKKSAPSQPTWADIDTGTNVKDPIRWKPIEPAIAQQIEEDINNEQPIKNPSKISIASENKENQNASQQENIEEGLRWPNGQLMGEADQIYHRSAWSRGSMVQIGETVYPNIGMNALQRAPGSWVELGITAIDDSWQWFGPDTKPDECTQGNFSSLCADGLMQNNIQLWSSPALSAELNWTIHSLSGEGAPFSFTFGDNVYGDGDSGTKFGEGQSLGFRIAKNFGKTFGISIGGNRLWHLDETTDLSKPLYVRGTKIFRLNDTLEPPIVSLTLGLMTDVFNPDTVIGTIQYPDWLLGGLYPSLFSEKYDGKNKRGYGRHYYPNVAGTSSAFVCAEETIFSGKPPTDKNKDCIKQVFIAPVGSVGFAPWPWLGFYANFTRNLNLGISLKPFKAIDWNISAHMIAPIVGLNSRQDLSIERNRCPDDQSFSACRTRIGIWTELSF